MSLAHLFFLCVFITFGLFWPTIGMYTSVAQLYICSSWPPITMKCISYSRRTSDAWSSMCSFSCDFVRVILSFTGHGTLHAWGLWYYHRAATSKYGICMYKIGVQSSQILHGYLKMWNLTKVKWGGWMLLLEVNIHLIGSL